MGDPLVYIDRSAIGPGMLDRVRAALDDLVAFIEANEPQLLAYGAYVDDDGTQMTVFHVHTDSASLEFHLDVAGPAFRPFVGLVTLEQLHGSTIDRPRSPEHSVAGRAQRARRSDAAGTSAGLKRSTPSRQMRTRKVALPASRSTLTM